MVSNIKAILLAGSSDFGRCELAARLPIALWPVAGSPVLERLLNCLADQGIARVTVCSNGGASLPAESIQVNGRMELEFIDGPLPTGTAGCIRDAIGGEKDVLAVVLPASTAIAPNIGALIDAHRKGDSELTMAFNPLRGDGETAPEPADIYVCDPSILEHIPEDGYFDIKENLIPKMLREGKTVTKVVLDEQTGHFRDRQSYLNVIGNCFEKRSLLDRHLKLTNEGESQALWSAAKVEIAAKSRICGPVAIMEGARICNRAVIIGPTVVGRNVVVGKDAVVINTVIWDGGQVGANCEIQRCIVDYDAVVGRDTIVEDKAISLQRKGLLRRFVGKVSRLAAGSTDMLYGMLAGQADRIDKALPDWVQSNKARIGSYLATATLLAVFLWSYWSGIKDLLNVWQRSDEYSSGLLVPFLAIYLLWSRRHDINQCVIEPFAWGLIAFVAAQGVRLFGLLFLYGSAERLSIVLSIAALVLLLFGWQVFRKAAPVLLFLCLMLPWPTRIQAAVAVPLQHWATSSAVFCLEMMGHEVIQEGNLIHIGETTVAVAEACNGLRMVTAFFVISGLIVMLVKRAWWEKLIILASSLPVALVCNTIRLTITSLAFTVLSGEHWEKLFHDFGGYAMMPLALAAVVAELWLLRKLTTLPEKENVIIVSNKGNKIVNPNRRRSIK